MSRARVVLLQLLDRPLAAVVRSELLDGALAEDAECRDQRVQLVQRVLAAPRRVDIEAERRHTLTVADLQDHARLEVRRAVRALVRAVLADHRLAGRRVLDVDVHVRVAVAEARQVQERALVHASAVALEHGALLSGSGTRTERTGGVEPPQPEASALQAAELTTCSAFAGEGRPTGFEPAPQGSRPRMLPLHHSRHEGVTMKRARTTGFEPAASRWTAGRSSPLSYVRMSSAGGIRTHGLELMRLARTASPLPRSLPGWIRTSVLRFPKPAGCPASLQADRDTPGGTRTRSFPVESRASSPFDHRGKNRSRRCWNRTSPCAISARRAATDTDLRT